MQSVQCSLSPLLFLSFCLSHSFLHQIHVNYYFTSTTYMDGRQGNSRGWERRKKSNEKRGLCSQSFHVYLHTAQRDAVAFLTSFTVCDMNTQTDTNDERELKMQAASCRNLFRWTCEIAKMEWIEVRWGDIRGKNSYLWSISEFRFTIHFLLINFI